MSNKKENAHPDAGTSRQAMGADFVGRGFRYHYSTAVKRGTCQAGYSAPGITERKGAI